MHRKKKKRGMNMTFYSMHTKEMTKKKKERIKIFVISNELYEEGKRKTIIKRRTISTGDK